MFECVGVRDAGSTDWTRTAGDRVIVGRNAAVPQDQQRCRNRNRPSENSGQCARAVGRFRLARPVMCSGAGASCERGWIDHQAGPIACLDDKTPTSPNCPAGRRQCFVHLDTSELHQLACIENRDVRGVLDLDADRIRRLGPLVRRIDVGVDLDAESSGRAVGRIVKIGMVDLDHHEHVDVVGRWTCLPP